VERRSIAPCALDACALALPALARSPRELRCACKAETWPLSDGTGPVHAFPPFAGSDEHQRVHSRAMTASIAGEVGRVEAHGNGSCHVAIARPRGRTGRGLAHGPARCSGPLNRFVSPHVEGNGRAWTGRVAKRFSHKGAPTGGLART
jgi:hypothetical protein